MHYKIWKPTVENQSKQTNNVEIIHTHLQDHQIRFNKKSKHTRSTTNHICKSPTLENQIEQKTKDHHLIKPKIQLIINSIESRLNNKKSK